jgi:AcrR family transcriptional regulator
MKPSILPAAPDRSASFEAKRLEILRQAATVFADEGYHQTSVGSLATRLGVSKPVLYYYAENKDDLLFQIFAASRDELQITLAETRRANLSGMGKIRRFFTKYVELLGSEFGRCFVMVDQRALEPATLERENRARRCLEVEIRAMIAEGQGDGSVKPCDPAIAARALFAAFNGIPNWYRPDGPMRTDDVAHAYLDLFVNGIGRG